MSCMVDTAQGTDQTPQGALGAELQSGNQNFYCNHIHFNRQQVPQGGSSWRSLKHYLIPLLFMHEQNTSLITK